MTQLKQCPHGSDKEEMANEPSEIHLLLLLCDRNTFQGMENGSSAAQLSSCIHQSQPKVYKKNNVVSSLEYTN